MLNKDKEWSQIKDQRLLHELITILNWLNKDQINDLELISKTIYIKNIQLEILIQVFLSPEGRQWISLFYKLIKDKNQTDNLLNSYSNWLSFDRVELKKYLIERLDLFLISLFLISNKSIPGLLKFRLDPKGIFPGINIAWYNTSGILIQLRYNKIYIGEFEDKLELCENIDSFVNKKIRFYKLPQSEKYNFFIDLASQVSNINFFGREQLPRLESDNFKKIESVICIIDQAIDFISIADPTISSYFIETVNYFTPLIPPVGALPSSSNSSIDTMIWHSYAENPLLMAEIIIHEFSHQKLFRLQDIDPLINQEFHGSGWDICTIYSPWRDDPRPINGVFHGFVVFSEACNFWLNLLKSQLLNQTEENISKRRFAMLVLQLEYASLSLSNVSFTSKGLNVYNYYKNLIFERYLPFVNNLNLSSLKPFFMEHHDEEELIGVNIKDVVLKHKNSWDKRNS